MILCRNTVRCTLSCMKHQLKWPGYETATTRSKTRVCLPHYKLKDELGARASSPQWTRLASLLSFEWLGQKQQRSWGWQGKSSCCIHPTLTVSREGSRVICVPSTVVQCWFCIQQTGKQRFKYLIHCAMGVEPYRSADDCEAGQRAAQLSQSADTFCYRFFHPCYL